MMTWVVGTAILLAPPPAKGAAVPEGRITVWTQDLDPGKGLNLKNTIRHFKPDGSDVKTVTFPEKVILPRQLVLDVSIITPDLSTLVYLDRPTNAAAGIRKELKIVSTTDGSEPFILKDYVVNQLFSPPVVSEDGSVRVIFTGRSTEAGARGTATYELDMASRKVKAFDVPEGHRFVTVSPDGKSVMTQTVKDDGGPKPILVHRLFRTTDGKPPVEFSKRENDLFQVVARSSRDGAKSVVLWRTSNTLLKTRNDWVVVDSVTGKETPIAGLPEQRLVPMVAMSPDGTRIVYAASGERGNPDRSISYFVSNIAGTEHKLVFKSPREPAAIWWQ